MVPLGEEGGKVSEVLFSDLKAVFFVKSLEGKQDHPLTKDVSEEKAEPGTQMKVKITFLDGETLMGTTQGYTLEREGFFIVPLEEDSKQSKNLRYLKSGERGGHLEMTGSRSFSPLPE